MDYYKRRSLALQVIDKMYSEGAEVESIEFKVSTLYGFGRKMIENRINLLKCISQSA